MSFRWVLIGGSLLAHGGLVVALGGIRTPAAHEATSIEVTEAKPPPPPAAQVEPPPPPPPPDEVPQRARKAKAAEAPPPEAAPAPQAQALSNLPDFGLELSGGGGPGGMAVRPTDAPAPRAAAPVTRTLTKAPAPPKATDTCADPPAKPRLLNLPQPAYTQAARAAGLEGKVRVQLTVDESGRVVDVHALSSLGQGLDEAALAAARAATFEPALRCGRPSRSTFTISIRFSAS